MTLGADLWPVARQKSATSNQVMPMWMRAVAPLGAAPQPWGRPCYGRQVVRHYPKDRLWVSPSSF